MIQSTAPRLFTEPAGLPLPPQGGRAADTAIHLPLWSRGRETLNRGAFPLGGGIPVSFWCVDHPVPHGVGPSVQIRQGMREHQGRTE